MDVTVIAKRTVAMALAGLQIYIYTCACLEPPSEVILQVVDALEGRLDAVALRRSLEGPALGPGQGNKLNSQVP